MKMLIPPHSNINNSRYGQHQNAPVNIDKVLTITKSREHYYPDNDGIPVIFFWFGDNNKHQWFFDKGQENLRDKTYNQIIEAK